MSAGSWNTSLIYLCKVFHKQNKSFHFSNRNIIRSKHVPQAHWQIQIETHASGTLTNPDWNMCLGHINKQSTVANTESLNKYSMDKIKIKCAITRHWIILNLDIFRLADTFSNIFIYFFNCVILKFKHWFHSSADICKRQANQHKNRLDISSMKKPFSVVGLFMKMARYQWYPDMTADVTTGWTTADHKLQARRLLALIRI